jgi:hypothetical protein
MKKLIGMIAIASVLSVVIMGCGQAPEGDPAPATPKSTTGTTGASTDNSSETLKPPPTGETAGATAGK